MRLTILQSIPITTDVAEWRLNNWGLLYNPVDKLVLPQDTEMDDQDVFDFSDFLIQNSENVQENYAIVLFDGGLVIDKIDE